MAIAGKVAITLSTENNGAWSADVTYDRLVAVKHNNNLYISRKTVANVEPPNDEFWFLALEGFSGDDIEDIINGTTQVGNAKTLDGHGAEDFLQKSGGTINGNVMVSKNGAGLVSVEDTANGRQIGLLTSNGKCGLYDYTNSKWVLENTADGTNTFNGTASGNLPLNNTTFPTVKNAQDTVMAVESTATTDGYSLMRYVRNNTNYGFLGFYTKDNPVFMPADFSARHQLLHTGNKPTGTYTGNGSATQRTVNTGGVGGVLLVYGGGNQGAAIVTPMGAICVDYHDGTVRGLKANEAMYNEGVLTLATTDLILNSASGTHTYKTP